ncbi:Response regulator receiver domain-containing protein [Halogranum amylolyticum]|uniref:Response regulator receiver domain-containing protein n=1 Tax=Halogranum amylolyticum TaxID=660520 RepID=A0A1H8PVY2_9EURY|nr:response regulator transcription factor [Halogranum amylolyticum]SEO45908.1 Response regulator receiver domain-containing protein [Halogranum amylolyticum]
MSDHRTVVVLAVNPRNRELLAAALDDGYTVERFSDLSCVERRLDDGIGLAVVDVDGFDRSVLSVVESFHTRGTPVVVLSRRVSSVLRRRAMDAGALVVLEKPVSRAELTHRVQMLLPANPRP